MSTPSSNPRPNALIRFLNLVEWIGNKLPDPAVLFVLFIGIVGVVSWQLSMVAFEEKDPREAAAMKDVPPIAIVNIMKPSEIATTMTTMVNTFVTFAPLGVVLVAMLGVGVAERAGFINAVLKAMLDRSPKFLLTPMVILVAIVSHTAVDAGYVLVIPLAGVVFYASGRHPLAGIAAAFAGVSGGFSANFVPSSIDPLLAGLTQTGARVINPDYVVNPLCNWYFTAASSFLIILAGWVITDRLIEPKLRTTPIDGDIAAIPKIDELSSRDYLALSCSLGALLLGLVALFLWAFPANSSLRDPLGKLDSDSNVKANLGMTFEATPDGVVVKDVTQKGAADAAGLQAGDRLLTIGGKPTSDLLALKQPLEEQLKADKPVIVQSQRGEAIKHSILTPKPIPGAPLMKSIVPLIFILFFIPGVVHGYVSGNFKNHRDVVAGMSKAMESMAYYLVLVFFVALFIYLFNRSNLGLLLAVKGANALRGQPAILVICGIVGLTALVNLLIGSASAKWSMLAPIFVPMLMELGISPELAQAAYRVGDSTTNIITPLLPYFPLVVVYGQRYYKGTGIGTITSLMLPYSITFLILWTAFLLLYWQIGLPLGLNAPYEYVKPN
ncbi:MAG: AbgT family transporter [Planctomycetaceae bacterium]|nr:AbgT family transporter [Planctomycetaceae bacterium]